MPTVVRHDAVTLRSGVKEEDFERFMHEEVVPYFSERYRGPTRSSRADLKRQSLLKDTRGRRRYLWVTVWDGSPESVRGAAFEHARMSRIEETDALLRKLDSFGKRSSEKVMSELMNTEVATNT